MVPPRSTPAASGRQGQAAKEQPLSRDSPPPVAPAAEAGSACAAGAARAATGADRGCLTPHQRLERCCAPRPACGDSTQRLPPSQASLAAAAAVDIHGDLQARRCPCALQHDCHGFLRCSLGYRRHQALRQRWPRLPATPGCAPLSGISEWRHPPPHHRPTPGRCMCVGLSLTHGAAPLGAPAHTAARIGISQHLHVCG